MLFKTQSQHYKKAKHEIHHLHNLLSEIWNSCDRQNVNFKLRFQPQQELFDLHGLVPYQEKITHTKFAKLVSAERFCSELCKCRRAVNTSDQNSATNSN